MDPATRLPDHLVEDALAFEDGTRTPAEPRHASTVVLLRPGTGGAGRGGAGPAGADPLAGAVPDVARPGAASDPGRARPGALEVYLLRRHGGMAFAAGMCVFPGGGVDPRDFDHAIGWAGPTPAQWASLMGVEEPLARALVCAAVRETFEESCVLLAGPSPDSVVGDTTGPDWEADRVALESREVSFTDVLDRRGLVLRTDLLRLWGAWVTPAFEPRRYDTRFFVAALPEGQVTRDVSTESDRVLWAPVEDALAQVHDGAMTMLPPTYCTLLELYDHTTIDSVLATADGREVDTVRPTVVREGEGARLAIPERYAELGASVRGRMRP